MAIDPRNTAKPDFGAAGGGFLSRPATEHFAITPANTDLARQPRAIYVNVTGDVELMDLDGVTLTYLAVAAGTILPIAAKQIRTGTTATVFGLV